jgi:hypothetical protein
MTRELAEMRRQFGIVLHVLDGQDLSGYQCVILAALDEAAEYLRDLMGTCSDCRATEGGLCATCDSRLTRVQEYDGLAARIRDAS